MADINEVVAYNIRKQLKLAGKKQGELVSVLKEPKKVILRMLSGAQEIPLPVISKVSHFCKVDLNSFFIEPREFQVAREAFMGRVSSDSGKRGLEMIQRLSDMYLFHNQYQTQEFKNLVSKTWNE